MRSSALQSSRLALLHMHLKAIPIHKYIYLLILVHKHTYFCPFTYIYICTYIYTYIHTYVSCKHIQVSPGPAAQLIAALGVKLVLAQFSEVMSPLFPCIRQLFQRHFVLQSQMNNDVLPGPEMSSGLVRNALWDVPGNSITKIQCAKLKGVSPSTTWACPQHLPARPTLIHHKQLLSLP